MELSYIEFGAVVNFHCAFAAFKEAALIESLTLTLQHTDGQRLDFFCVGLSEGSTAESSSGERVNWNKSWNVHTLAIARDSSVERLVMFREISVATRLSELSPVFGALRDRLMESDGEKWRDAMRRSVEFDAYRTCIREGLPWRAGRYTASMTAKVTQFGEPLVLRFEFDLSEAQLRDVKSNLLPLDKYVVGLMVDDVQPMQRPPLRFVFPAIQGSQ